MRFEVSKKISKSINLDFSVRHFTRNVDSSDSGEIDWVEDYKNHSRNEMWLKFIYVFKFRLEVIMKFYILIISLFLYAYIEQVDSEQNDFVELVTYIDTYGEAMDLDLTDSRMVVAANYQGYIVYDLSRDNLGNISSVDSIYNDSILDDSMGDNRAQEVIVSDNHDIAFITDIFDRIWLYKLNDESNQYVDSYLQDCYGGTWLSTAIDDQTDVNQINVFSLVKHSSSESDDEGTVGDFDEYSTSVVWKGLKDISSDDLFPEQNSSPACEFSYNFGILPEAIHYNDGLLAVSNGELGVKVLSQIDESSCFDSNTFELLGEFNPSGNIDVDRIACENSIFDYYNPGLGGIFEPEGGFHPQIYSSFDLPGEVNAVYVKDLVLFSGLSTVMVVTYLYLVIMELLLKITNC